MVMGISLKPAHLRRYRNIARLLVKYGRGDLLRAAGLGGDLEQSSEISSSLARERGGPVHQRPGEILELEARRAKEPSNGKPKPKAKELHAVAIGEASGDRGATQKLAVELADDLEKMGPTYVKVGQFLSTRPDLLPVVYCEALARLQDEVEPFPFEEVEHIVAEELGIRLSKAFREFDHKPVAAASLGQVHRAQLRSGRLVAVKVQRPRARDRTRNDLEVFDEVASMLDKHTDLGKRFGFTDMVEEFRKSLTRELDYPTEARNLAILGENLAHFEQIVVPQPIEGYVTSRVLTMEYISGRKVNTLGPLSKLEMNSGELSEELCRAYLQQIMVDGFFHADPHPGNVLLTEDCRLALIDLGMVATVAPRMQERLLKLVIAFSEGRGDEAGAVLLQISRPGATADSLQARDEIAKLVTTFQGHHASDNVLGRMLFEAVNVASKAGYRLPSDLTLLAKALLNLDEVGRHLDPEFDANASIRRNVTRIARRRMLKSMSLGKVLAGTYETKEFLEKLPRRLNQLFENVAENRLSFHVDAINEAVLMEGMQKVANRITLGVVIAAMVIGAALVMRVDTKFRILGYPGIAILLFLLAAISGIVMVANILISDIRADKARLKKSSTK